VAGKATTGARKSPTKVKKKKQKGKAVNCRQNTPRSAALPAPAHPTVKAAGANKVTAAALPAPAHPAVLTKKAAGANKVTGTALKSKTAIPKPTPKAKRGQPAKKSASTGRIKSHKNPGA